MIHYVDYVDANDERNQQTIGSAKIAGLHWSAKCGPPVLVQTAEPPLMNLEPPTGVEPVTPALQVRCSAGLSYGGAVPDSIIADQYTL